MQEIYEVTIIDEDINGNGIAKVNGIVVFIKDALINEKIKIAITKKHKHFYEAKIIEVLLKSPKRINVPCKYYKDCGGCNFEHITLNDELKKKQEYINHKFHNYAVKDIICENEYNYRNKITLHVKNNKIGFYKEETNELIEIDYCFLADEEINNLIKKLKKLNLAEITEIVIRKTLNTDEIMVKIIGNITKQELERIKPVTSIYLNNNLIIGKPYITEVINDIKYTIYPDAFFQINTKTMVKLYEIIKKYVGSGKRLLDLYCGTGTIGIYLSENFKQITGIEINEHSVKNANLNKEINNLSNIKIFKRDASAIKETYDVIVLDPPRKGLSKRLINNLLELDTKKIVYVSCNPNTLKKDLDILEKKYSIHEMIPINMFPRTKHIECVCVLKLR